MFILCAAHFISRVPCFCGSFLFKLKDAFSFFVSSVVCNAYLGVLQCPFSASVQKNRTLAGLMLKKTVHGHRAPQSPGDVRTTPTLQKGPSTNKRSVVSEERGCPRRQFSMGHFFP